MLVDEVLAKPVGPQLLLEVTRPLELVHDFIKRRDRAGTASYRAVLRRWVRRPATPEATGPDGP